MTIKDEDYREIANEAWEKAFTIAGYRTSRKNQHPAWTEYDRVIAQIAPDFAKATGIKAGV